MNMFTMYYKSPIGILKLGSSQDHLLALDFESGEEGGTDKLNPVLEEVKYQLDQYFADKRKIFDLPLLLQGTEFQRHV